MRRSFVRRAALLAVLAGPIAACSDSPTTPTTPTPLPPVTDTFAGTLNVNGAASYPFVTAGAGSITATLKSLDPDNTVVIGLAVGTWDGTGCTVFKAIDSAGVNATLLVTATAAGSICVRVADSNKLTAATNFSVEIVHP